MLLLGFEVQDILRVVVGIALALLTVYRRELSSNRGYHPDEDNASEDIGSSYPLGQGASSLLNSDGEVSNADNDTPPPPKIRRRKSSSALPSMTASSYQSNDDDDIHSATVTASEKNSRDPTEELLESAGLILSGGPFLAMTIAIIDHLVLTSFIAITSMISLMHKMRTKRSIATPHGLASEEETLEQLLPEARHDTDDMAEQQSQQHLYSVAWNAATEYFTNISQKLDKPIITTVSSQSSRNSTQCNAIPQSKSTGDLQQHLPDERSRALFREMLAMANSGSMDITLLPSDAFINIFSYLPAKDVLAFTCTNRAGQCLLDDGNVNVILNNTAEDCDDDEDVLYHDKNSDTPLLIWKVLFNRDFAWVLTEWDIGKEAVMRSMTDYHEALDNNEVPHNDEKQHGRVFHHLASTIIIDSDQAKRFPTMENMKLMSASIHPTSSMKEFYFTFIETWLNYTIAGCNSTEQCLIGLHGHVFNITDFVEDHPGSTETLLLQSGRDATVFFESMGHSLGARKIALGMCAVVNQASLLGETAKSNETCALVKPTCIGSKKNTPGFLIPRKRSRPRFQGGLHQIRQRIRLEEASELGKAAIWASESLGQNGLFGGIQVYYDPLSAKWKWWYTDRDFNTVFTTSR